MKTYILFLLLFVARVKATIYYADCTIPVGQNSAFYKDETVLTDGWYPFGSDITSSKNPTGSLPITKFKLNVDFTSGGGGSANSGDMIKCNQDLPALPFAGKYLYLYLLFIYIILFYKLYVF